MKITALNKNKRAVSLKFMDFSNFHQLAQKSELSDLSLNIVFRYFARAGPQDIFMGNASLG